MWDELDFLPISALQHLVFCPRQCALIHIEAVWAENVLTVEGKHLHEKADLPGTESRGNLRIARGLRLRCVRLGLTGQADVVEFHRVGEEVPSAPPGGLAEGVALPGAAGLWRPSPVDYKHGRPKPDHSDMAQLCAQALCLEEMLGAAVPHGAIFYGLPRRRLEVEFGPELRQETEAFAARLHALAAEGRTPPAVFEPKCKGCSLLMQCQPRATQEKRHATADYLARAIRKSIDDR